MNAVAIRGDWVGQVIDGRYPLLEWLGGSGSSGTYLTELDGLGSRKAAIKLFPSSPKAEDRFSGWAAAAQLSHPHLAHIDHFGRAEVETGSVVYIVTDLAEELLSQIVPERALSADETRQMLSPVLDVLGFLHNQGYVHGHLKPSNILVVENEIKLSSDGLIVAGKPAPELLRNDIYIAPEASSGPISQRADIWSLGITLVEALTQEVPIWDSASDVEPILPASIPEPFAEIARKCLRPDPSRRCSLAEIRTLLEPKAKPVSAKPVQKPPQDLPRPTQVREEKSEKPLPSRMPYLPLLIGLVLIAAIIIGLRIHSRKAQTAPLQTETSNQAPAAEPDSKAQAPQPQHAAPAFSTAPTSTATASSATTASAGDVLNRDVPDVSSRARNTIHGTVSVIVRVSVDSIGAVTNADFATHGPSAYFARVALDSARNWKFKPAQQNGSAVPSSWLLHYKFRRDGVEVVPKQSGVR
jgi:TonB family protein